MNHILEVKNLSKYYPGVKALDNVSLSFEKGEVHAIVGENGAGKSTLIKLLTGAIQPTNGSILIDNREYDKLSPQESMGLGISVIYQEFTLVPYLTIAENIFFGSEIMNGVIRDVKMMNKKTAELCESMGVSLNPKARVCDLGVAYQQIVEIIKAVSKKARILIMDEPSAPLTTNETKSMFNIVRKLKADGVTILYISHRMEEIFELCDRVSVMRDGKYITTMNIVDADRKTLIAHMVGRELGESFPEGTMEAGDVVLEAKNISNKSFKDISFQLKRGEVMGFGGLVGAGRTELARALYGADKIESGEVILNGQVLNCKSPKDGIKNGIGLIPEDRKRHGVVLGMKIRENITYSVLKKISKNGFVQKEKENEICKEYQEKLRIKTPSLNQLVKNLSGGNQQKVVLAKVLALNCDVLIFDEPTRGIDVAAKQEIYQIIRDLVDKDGKSVIMISSEMPELIGMSDKIIVMSEGRISGELMKDEFSQERILELASIN